MDSRNQLGQEPLRQGAPPDQYDDWRWPTVSPLRDAGAAAHYDDSSYLHELRTKASFVSSQSDQATAYSSDHDNGSRIYTPDSTWSGSFAYRGGYAPVSNISAAPPRRTHSINVRNPSYRSLPRQKVPAGIQEEEYDLSLLKSAALMGTSAPYDVIPDDDEAAPPGVDITSAMGPMTTHDAEFIKSLQEQEANGNLTGGLGQGFRPDSRLRDTELLSSPTSIKRSLSRSFAQHKSANHLTRKDTIRFKGQAEANRRGEVIEVVLETTPTDLSNFEGSNMLWDPDTRRSAVAGKVQETQIFYPQPNWKPWSMRWPYLTMMILLSVTLAVMQEALFQKYEKIPLLQFQKPSDVKPGLYFAVKFAPTLCAVIYGVLWQFVDFEVRRLEAFYQLSKPGGALAAESMNVDYVTSFSFMRPFRALTLGHHAVALSSIATTLAISLVPTFASASVILSPSREERMNHPNGDKYLHFSPEWSRLLTSTLAVCSAAGIGLLFLLQSRRTGLLSNVRGIAGLASMAVVSHILMDFKDMDTSRHKDIHQKLKHNRYILRNSSLAPDNENPATSQERAMYEDGHMSENPHPLMLRLAGFIPFAIALWGFMGFIPAFLFTEADAVSEKAPWFVTAVSVCLKMSWNALETAVRVMEPYYILSKRHAPSVLLTLDYTAMPFGYLPIKALLNGHTIMFLVGFGSVIAEFLTILVTGLATVDGKDFLLNGDGNVNQDGGKFINSGQETTHSFYVSFGIAMFILLYMSVVSCIVFFRRRHPFLPRQPNTISSVLAYIHQSKMLYDFVGTEKFSSAQIVKKLDDGKTYGLGWFQGRDGQIHCGIDQEELTSSYKHGVDYTQRNQPWNTPWDTL
ncbi:uncharacterized protein MAM_03112 [Metarhizium album ARSEF 1941]|uniref:DUF3433 domain protein n=1 Tax=Metarhizium album (strain ARSEF 1941) TaxID=1081103 RepID=A0A0B2X0N6_METAS|nr:uncharacterized protein MAM_03112 [Metarhizium album ARSEF 1941]KHN99414.1 hypothetical protein MAM_03112 [Metarhizium album ARSEF 1941]